ncbi:MAG: hypothetical protein LRY51_08165 [Geovibrio sp.]|nr:hypothetical protein [Geovibrio sp.]
MMRYYLLLSDLSLAEIEQMKKDIAEGALHPMEAKKTPRSGDCDQILGSTAGADARENFEKVFSNKENPEDMPEFISGSKSLLDIIRELDFAPSNGEAKRTAKQGGVYLDNERIENLDMIPSAGEHILKVGKRKFARIIAG